MEQTVSFYTFGCRLNQAETAIMQRGFEEKGYRVVQIGEPADVAVVNTCTVTQNGDADTRRMVNKINRLNRDCDIALVGCQAQVQRERLLSLPGVRWVVGNGVKMELAELLEAGTDEPRVIAPTIKRGTFTIPFAGVATDRTRANLKIQDGCDFFCTFCEIPYARGRARSRQFQDIFVEARELVAAGYREVVLTGINIGTYSESYHRFEDVLSGLNDLDGLDRIRISSIEPTTLPPTLVAAFGRRKLCRHLHIPIQSGSDSVLAAMKRKYTTAHVLDFINGAFAQNHDLCIGTDVIVGFPGESEADFDDTYAVLRDGPFAYFHVFSYSERDHAKSKRLPGKISREQIAHRSQRLRELSLRKRRDYQARFLGGTELVLFEQEKAGKWRGLTDHYIRVEVASDMDLNNELLPVRLEAQSGQMVLGKLV